MVLGAEAPTRRSSSSTHQTRGTLSVPDRGSGGCNAGAQPDVLLALSSVLGSGLFITTVVLACVLLAAPQPVVLDWTFRRDTLAYLVSVLLILGAGPLTERLGTPPSPALGR